MAKTSQTTEAYQEGSVTDLVSILGNIINAVEIRAEYSRIEEDQRTLREAVRDLYYDADGMTKATLIDRLYDLSS